MKRNVKVGGCHMKRNVKVGGCMKRNVKVGRWQLIKGRSIEEHFAFKATCEHEDDKKYNVYPTCEGTTFRKDKDEDSKYDSDEEMPSLCDSDLASNDDRPYGNQGIYYDSDDDENMTDSIVRALLQYIDSRIVMAEPMEASLFYEDSSELDPTTRTLLNPEAKTTNIDNVWTSACFRLDWSSLPLFLLTY